MTDNVRSIVGVPRPSIDRAYLGLRASDEVVAKVLAVSLVAQIARAERRLREYLEAKWASLAREATKTATSMAASGKSATAITTAIDNAMRRWPGSVEDVVESELNLIYKLGRRAGHKKAVERSKGSLQYDTPNYTSETDVKKAEKTASVEPKFDLADEGAMKALNKHQLFWIGEHYDKNVSTGIADVTRKVIVEAGGNRTKAGKAMAERVADSLAHVRTPEGFHGSSKQYFEGLVANAATVARAHSQMRSFMDIGITKYKIVNPLDERTCPVCHHMDGRTFTMKEGAAQMHAELKARTPESVRKVHPWMGKKITKLTSSSALAGAGQALPPYHFRCRCTCDISDDIGSWDDLEPMSPPTAEEPAAPKPAKEPEATSEQKARDKVSQTLQDAKMVAMKKLGGGVNASSIATLEHEGAEVKGVWKEASGEAARLRRNVPAGTYYKREAASASLDTMLGEGAVVPPTIARKIEGEDGSLQHFAKGAMNYKPGNKAAKMLDAIRAAKENLADNESFRRVFLLDALTGNDDRHGGNIMFKVAKLGGKDTLRAVAIDNGLTFPHGEASRFIFPSTQEWQAGKFLKLDEVSHKQVKSLDLSKVADMLKEHGLPKEAVRPTLMRIRALQDDPDVLFKMMKGELGMNYTKGEIGTMMEFIEFSAYNPSKFMNAKSVEAVEAVVKTTFK